jgi:scyllo-inositol 2-dehydrogenase (NADP+)
MNKVIQVGIAGYGIASKVFHAPFLKVSPHYEVVAVLERHHEESKALFPNVQIVRTFEELLQTNVDLIVIATPNETHYPYAKGALLAGKAVVVDKPFTIRSEEALELDGLAKQTGTLLTVYHNRRYVSDFLTIQQLLKQQLLGDIHTFEGTYLRYRPEKRPNAWREKPEPGSGILYDLGPHLIDQVLYFFGLPKFITADVRLQRPHAQADDWFTVTLDYGFLQATLKAGMLVREQGPRYIIHGTKGSFIKNGEDPQEAKLRAGEMPSETLGVEGEEFYGLLHTEVNGDVIKEYIPSQKGDYGLFYEDLYNTIVHGAPLKITPLQAYNVVKLIEIAFESSKKRCTLPVEGLVAAY